MPHPRGDPVRTNTILRPRNAGTFYRNLLPAAVAVGLCSGHAVADTGWQPGMSHDQTFTTVLIVGVSPDPKQRCPFEHFLLSRIQNDKTAAFASCDVAKPRDPLTRESIEGAVAAVHADAVVATSLVSREWEAQHGGSRDTRGTAGYKATDAGYATGWYGAYGVPVIYGDFQSAPPVTIMQGKVEVSTRVYRTQDA